MHVHCGLDAEDWTLACGLSISLGFQSIALICNNFLEMRFLKIFFLMENRHIWNCKMFHQIFKHLTKV
jgi:hypothetical protein